MNEQILTPTELITLVQIFYRQIPLIDWFEGSEDARNDVVDKLRSLDLIKTKDMGDTSRFTYSLTELGRAHVSQLLQAKLPTFKWVNSSGELIKLVE